MSLFLALLRHAAMSALWSLLGDKRTLGGDRQTQYGNRPAPDFTGAKRLVLHSCSFETLRCPLVKTGAGMKRRDFMMSVGAAVAPLAAVGKTWAQPAGQTYRLGVLVQAPRTAAHWIA